MSEMETLIVLMTMSLIFFLLYRASKRVRANIKNLGIEVKDVIHGLNYKCGHPSLDDPRPLNMALLGGNILLLGSNGKQVAGIEGRLIKNIAAEDQSTFERRVTLARMALVGIFAFAIKKKKKDELAYLTIEWSDGRFEHHTMFEFAGTGSMNNANKIRNKIINHLSQHQ